MADVFVSYAREDQAVVRKIVAALESRGKTTFVDWAGIEPSDRWRDSIREAIEESDAVVCILSPDLLASEVCATEREQAEQLSKRLVPVVAREVDPGDVPPSLVEPNWILLGDGDIDGTVDALVRALDTDLDLVRLHTRLLSRALAWDAAGRKRTSLLRGQDLKRAVEWLARAAAGARPQPTELQIEFIEASRKGAGQRQRIAVAGALAVAAVAAGLSVFAFISRAQAVHESHVAFSRELAADSSAQLDHDPQLALLLGTEALERAPTPASEAAVVAALDQGSVTRIVRVGSPVLDVAYAANGQVAAAAAANGTVRIWNPSTTTTPLTLAVRGPITAIALHPSGSVLVTGSPHGRLTVWSRSTNRWHPAPHGYQFDTKAITSLAFSPSGNVLAVGSADHTVRLIPNGRPVRTIRTKDAVTSVAFGASDNTLATAGPAGTSVWNLSSKRPHPVTFTPEIPTQAPRRVALDTSGSGLVAIAGNDGEIRLWDYTSFGVGLLSGHVGRVNDVAFSPDGTLLASAGIDGTVRLWDIQSRQQIRVLGGHRRAVNRVVFSPNGSTVLTASQDGTAREWHISRDSAAARGALFPDLGLTRHLTGVAISARGQLVATSVDGDVHDWPLADAGRGELWTCSIPQCEVRAQSATGIAASDSFVVVPAKPTHLLRSTDGHIVRTLPAASAAALSSDGHELALVTNRAGVEFWQHGVSGQAHALPVPRGVRIAALAFAAGGDQLAGAANGGQIVLWERTHDWRFRVLSGAAGDLRSIAFTPDRRSVVAGSSDGNAWLWNVAGGRPQTFVGHAAPVNAVAVSPNGQILATASDDFTARLWDISTRATIRVLAGHTDVVTGIAFSPDGAEVATTAADGEVRLWDGCLYCLSPRLLLARAKRASVRCLTALERRVYLHEHVTEDEPCAA